MLLIEQFDGSAFTQGSFVKCPACKTGRLFDRAEGVQVKTVPGNHIARGVASGVQMYIKCPKCARRIGVSFAN